MIIRTYSCGDCNAVFEVTCSSNDPDPPCPNCERVLDWRPTSFNTTGVKSKAIDYTQKVMEQDYGLSNFKDNSREGDVGYIDPTRKTTVEKEKIEREVREIAAQVGQTNPAVQGFWGGPANQNGQTNPMVAQNLIAAAKSGPGSGVDAMAQLHKLGKEGKLPNNYRIMARDKLG